LTILEVECPIHELELLFIFALYEYREVSRSLQLSSTPPILHKRGCCGAYNGFVGLA
jgi:hypothetical protein